MQLHAKLVKISLESVALAALLCFGGWVHAYAQSTAASAPANTSTQVVKPVPTTIVVKTSADTWNKLTPSQQTALQPLSTSWASLTDGHKRKWIAVSTNFAQFSPEDKTKLHSRMTEWASLSTKQREQARINFAQNKKLTATDKQAKWETYQALPPETKQALANIDVAPKPTGAATAAKPVDKDKLVASTPKSDKSTAR